MEKKKKIALIASVISVCVVVVIVCSLSFSNKTGEQYEFKISSSVKNYDTCSETCLLISRSKSTVIADNLGAQGQKYHDKIRELVKSKKKGVWVGLSDNGNIDGWQFANSIKLFTPNQGNTLFPLGDTLFPHKHYDGFPLYPQCVFYSPETGKLESTSCYEKEFYCLCEIKNY